MKTGKEFFVVVAMRDNGFIDVLSDWFEEWSEAETVAESYLDGGDTTNTFVLGVMQEQWVTVTKESENRE